jgi:hypothetical protein
LLRRRALLTQRSVVKIAVTSGGDRRKALGGSKSTP